MNDLLNLIETRQSSSNYSPFPMGRTSPLPSGSAAPYLRVRRDVAEFVHRDHR